MSIHQQKVIKALAIQPILTTHVANSKLEHGVLLGHKCVYNTNPYINQEVNKVLRDIQTPDLKKMS